MRVFCAAFFVLVLLAVVAVGNVVPSRWPAPLVDAIVRLDTAPLLHSTDFETSAGNESDPARPAPQVEPRGTFFVFVLATCDGVAVFQPRMTVFAAALSMSMDWRDFAA